MSACMSLLKRKPVLGLVLGSICSILWIAPAGATLIGDEITITTLNRALAVVGDPRTDAVIDTVIVGDGRELAFNDGSNFDRLFATSGDSIDVTAAGITLTFGFGTDNAFAFSGLDWVGDRSGTITDVRLVSLTPGGFLDRIDALTFSAHEIFIDVLTQGRSTFIFEIQASDRANQVSEPDAASLFALGLIGFGLWNGMRCAKKRNDPDPGRQGKSSDEYVID